MRKHFLILSFSLLSISLYCQKFDAFKYVHISSHYAYYEKVGCYAEDTDKKLNEFSYKEKKYRAKADTILDGWSYLKKKFSGKGFEVLPASFAEWPNEALNNIELILWCYPYYGLGEAISIQLSNSNWEPLLEVDFPYFAKNYCHISRCFEKCWDSINVHTYSYDENIRIQLDLPEAEQSGETLKTLQTYFDSSDLDRIEGIYMTKMTGVNPYYSIGIKKNGGHYRAIILDSQLGLWQEGDVKATFQKSLDENKFSASWYSLNRKKCTVTAQVAENGDLSIGGGDCSNSTQEGLRLIKTYPFK